jgi:hypothetical protein
VDVGKLGDAKALEGFGQSREGDTPAGDFHVEPAVKQPIGGSHERCSA